MFKLQRLEISGFKSFAEYTEIIFTDSGITAVVGPNGCGKSNISDAITWVLGEQKAKNLRGGEMQDVIFAGAKSRQPSGMAEVVLHFVRDESAAIFDAQDVDDIDAHLSDFDEQISVNSEQLAFISQNGEAFEANGNGRHSDANGENGKNANGENGNGFHGETNGGTNGNGNHEINAEVATVEIVAANGDAAKTTAKRRWQPRRTTLDFAPGAAVSITRRLYRSGDSEYLLNGRACRLRDIQDLFAGTGLSGGHYALVQQEKISQILSAKPADRRQLIEEAAGVTKFRTRQRAAEIRLDAAKTNLRRLSDIVSEVDKQTNALRRQAARTRRYKELQEQFLVLLRKVFVAEARELSGALDDLRQKLTAAVVEENRCANEVAQIAEKASEATKNARAAEENLAQARQKAAHAELNRTRAASELAHQTEQAKDLTSRNHELNGEIKSLQERLKIVSADHARLQEKNQTSDSSNETENAALREAEAFYQQKLAKVRQTEAALETARSEAWRHTTAAERFAEIAKQQANQLEKFVERREGLKREATRAENTHLERIGEFEAANKTIETARENLRGLKEQKQAATANQQTARENLTAQEKDASRARDEANATRARRETLLKLDNQNALLAPAVQKLFAAADKIGVKTRGTLADFLRVEARHEKAVEAAFGANLQTVLIETEADAQKIAEWLKTFKAGTLNLLVANLDDAQNAIVEKSNAGENENQQNNNKIADLIGVNKNLRQTLETVLSCAMNLRVIENLAQGVEFADQDCVTLDGDVVRRNQFFAFGVGNSQTNEKGGILSFKRELRELAAQAEVLKIKVEQAENAVKAARESLSAAEKTLSEISGKIAQVERELMSLEMNARNLKQEIERAERHKKVVEDETKRLAAEETEVENKRAKAASDLKFAREAGDAANKRVAEIAQKLSDLRKSAETANSALGERRTLIAAANERRRSLQNALRRVESEQRDLENRLRNRVQESKDANDKLEKLRASIAALETQTAASETEKQTEAQAIDRAAKRLQTARESADKLALESTEANKSAAQAKDARAVLAVRQAEIATKLENLHAAANHELHQSLNEILPHENTGDFDLIAGKQKAEDLRQKLENFGAVNLLALEELGEAEERLLFLSSQRKDIVDGIAAAEEALAEIKRRSRERFERAFAEINRNFTTLFGEIFGGGMGEMKLLDASDVLESGVEIIAQPPGKRLQNLLLLSGGEKALTAIALVLAIFRFRPAPFCLLDEVDAPLDEANVVRFVEKIREMSEKTQFLVITHNKRTMEAARALYGVTMQEAGVSKVVSVKFE